MRALGGAGVVAVVGPAVVGPATIDGILDGEAAAFEVLEVVEFDGFGCGGDVLESYVAESEGWLLVVVLELIESFALQVGRDWWMVDGVPFTETSMIHNDFSLIYRSCPLEFFLQILRAYVEI